MRASAVAIDFQHPSGRGRYYGLVARPAPPPARECRAAGVEAGRAVKRGEPLLVLSAMKTETQLVSPVAGRVRSVNARVGARVRPGQVLVQVEPEGGSRAG